MDTLGTAGTVFTAAEKAEAAEREVALRKRVYANRIATGRMTPNLARRQIALMENIAADYRRLAEQERLL